ncbi:MAG: hypothetical protein J6N15_13410 [Ruminiclostridium sp.]|nr:hypothetical protein [Ruminiclostridium sp.]
MKALSGKLMPVAALIAAIACGVVRFFQMMSLTELDTGFFIRGSEVGGAVIYIMLAVFAVVLCALAFIGNKRGADAFTLSSDGMGSNATRVLGIAEIFGAFLIGLHVTDIDAAPMTMIFSGAAALALFVSGGMLMARVIPPRMTGHLKLAAAVYMFIHTAGYFNSDLVVLHHAEHLIVLIADVCAVVFLLGYARFCARLETTRSRLGEVIFAIITFLPSATHLISELLAKAFGGKAVSEFASLDYDACAAAVISGAFLAVLFFTEKNKEIVPIADE